MDISTEKKLPVGIENFEKIRKDDFYYIDKTGFIKELLLNWGKVNLFTRPRRFGKSLNMSMLKCFFEPESDKSIFDGLDISWETALCEKYRGKFPVISISLKEIHADSYEAACSMAAQVINKEARRHQYLSDSVRLTAKDKESFSVLLDSQMSESDLCYSLSVLSELLEKHYGRKVILLIDEYDVPLEKAFGQGYYDRMVLFVRKLLGAVLKTNDSLKFAVITGCLRISKESIFTGLNNILVHTIADAEFDKYFGFTDDEVRKLLEYYRCSDSYETVKEWYDGYHFGNTDVYCPWDVLCHCSRLRTNTNIKPQDYWSNTSSNDIVRHFIKKGNVGTTKNEIERLIAGEAIQKEIHMELTYKELYESIDNIWSVLFLTGYLTQQGEPQGDVFRLVIPNLEIRNIFTRQIMEFFKETVRRDGESVNFFCEALKNGDAKEVEKQFQGYLRKTISIRDTFVKKKMKENFYHGILLGLLGFKENWIISSNRESGTGYSDILIEIEEDELGIVIEVKYPDNGNLEAGCKDALEQIKRKQYIEQLQDAGMRKILKYGIACYKKQCKVLCE